MELIEAIVPNDILNTVEEGRVEELIQYLTDFGYLNLTLSFEQKKLLLNEAILQFRKEAFESGLTDALPFPNFTNGIVASAKEMELLNHMASFDGDFNITFKPDLTFYKIHTRVLHYRLKMLGIYNGKTESDYGIETNDALYLMAIWLKVRVLSAPFSLQLEMAFRGIPVVPNEQKQFKEFLDLTGDINEMTRIIFANNSLKYTSIFFISSGNNQSNSRVDFTYLLSEKAIPLDDLYLKKNFWTKNTNDADILSKRKKLQNYLPIEQRLYLFSNKAFLHLVQLHLWTKGFYNTIIDGSIEVESIQALKDFCGFIEKEFDSLVFDLGKGKWALNTELFFTEINKLVNENDTNTQVYRDDGNIEELKRVLDEKTKNERKEDLLENDFKKEWKATVNMMSLGRRIYFGFRSLIRSAINGLKKLGLFFRRLFEKLKTAAVNFAKLLYREIREAVKVLKEGFEFLFSKRKIHTRYLDKDGKPMVISSDFAIDFDVVNIIPANADPQQLHLHNQKCLSKTQNLFFTLSFTGTIIHYILELASGIGWAKILIEIGLEFKKAIKEKINN